MAGVPWRGSDVCADKVRMKLNSGAAGDLWRALPESSVARCFFGDLKSRLKRFDKEKRLERSREPWPK